MTELCLENPCVGGSIPPLATGTSFTQRQFISGWRFCLWNPQLLISHFLIACDAIGCAV
jgi:hypothetical protein